MERKMTTEQEKEWPKGFKGIPDNVIAEMCWLYKNGDTIELREMVGSSGFLSKKFSKYCEIKFNNLLKTQILLSEAVQMIQRLVDEIEELGLEKKDIYIHDVVMDAKENFLQKMEQK